MTDRTATGEGAAAVAKEALRVRQRVGGDILGHRAGGPQPGDAIAGQVEQPVAGVPVGEETLIRRIAGEHSIAQVGRNLADHRVLTMQYRIRRGGNNLGLRHPRLALSVLDYVFRGKGPLAQSSFVAGGLVKQAG